MSKIAALGMPLRVLTLSCSTTFLEDLLAPPEPGLPVSPCLTGFAKTFLSPPAGHQDPPHQRLVQQPTLP